MSLRTVRVLVDIPQESPRFDGHFPGAPRLPAVALLHDWVLPELRKQAGNFSAPWGFKRLRFSRALLPGAQVEIQLTEKERGSWSFEVREHEQLCASGSIYFSTELREESVGSESGST